jgi:hypothetical protein
MFLPRRLSLFFACSPKQKLPAPLASLFSTESVNKNLTSKSDQLSPNELRAAVTLPLQSVQ